MRLAVVFAAFAIVVACGGEQPPPPPETPPINQAVEITVTADTVAWTGGDAIKVVIEQEDREWSVGPGEERYTSPLVMSDHFEGSTPDLAQPFMVTIETEYARVTSRIEPPE
jgi:hypothetical protein